MPHPYLAILGARKRRKDASPRLDMFGRPWPKDLAYIINGERVTFAMLREARIQRQAEHLIRKLADRGPVRQAAHIWVFFVPGTIYGGWHLYLRTLKHSWWLKRPEGIALDIMAAFPCGILPLPENFYEWKKAFAATYSADRDGRQQGIIHGWVECDSEGGRPRRFTPTLQHVSS